MDKGVSFSLLDFFLMLFFIFVFSSVQFDFIYVDILTAIYHRFAHVFQISIEMNEVDGDEAFQDCTFIAVKVNEF